MRYQGFTLIEVLIVLAIIAALSAMLIGVLFVGDTTAQDTACRHNLKQIASALTNWQLSNGGSDKFPGKLLWLSDANKGGRDLEGDFRIYRCPHDHSEGADPNMGRPAAWNAGWALSQTPFEEGSSYLYEMSQADCPMHSGVTWATWKRWQRQFGNGTASYPAKIGGRPFPGSQMPILRCFHHHDWDSVSEAEDIQRVFNVSWGANVFTSRPQWELDIP